MSEWIKCSDRLPKVGERVLATVSVGSVMGLKSMSLICWMIPSNCEGGKDWDLQSIPILLSVKIITHWMPLPSPPEDSK